MEHIGGIPLRGPVFYDCMFKRIVFDHQQNYVFEILFLSLISQWVILAKVDVYALCLQMTPGHFGKIH